MIAGALLVLELFWPVFLCLWLGFATAGVGFLLLVFPSTPPEAQVAIFGVLSFVTVVAWWRYRRAHAPGG